MSKEDREENVNTILRELNAFEETVKQVGEHKHKRKLRIE